MAGQRGSASSAAVFSRARTQGKRASAQRSGELQATYMTNGPSRNQVNQRKTFTVEVCDQGEQQRTVCSTKASNHRELSMMGNSVDLIVYS